MSTSSVSTCKTSLSTSCIPTGYILVRSEESAKADLVEAKSLSSVEEDSKEKKASVVSVPKSLGKIRPKGSIKVKLRSYAQMIPPSVASVLYTMSLGLRVWISCSTLPLPLRLWLVRFTPW